MRSLLRSLLILSACGAPQPALPPPSITAVPVDAAAPGTGATDATPADAAPVLPPLAPDAMVSTLKPEPVYIEQTADGQLVNCDLLVRNTAATPLELTEIQVDVYDRANQLVFRKFASGNGVSPAIQTVPSRVVGPDERRLIMNPLHTFPRDLDLSQLRFTLTFQRSDGAQTLTQVEVKPREFAGKAKLVLPVRGPLIAWSGHDYLSHHRRWDYADPRLVGLGFASNAGRYSYDLLVVDKAGQMKSGPDADNASWFSFGKPVLAPAAGKVVAVDAAQPDNRQFDMAAIAKSQLVIYGNHVVIEHAAGEYSLLAHLKQHSVQVKVGDTVRAGQEIAAIGASGSSLMPHLHYQLQTKADVSGEGLPAYFHQFVKLRGARTPIARGHVDTGDLVESRAK